MDHLTDNEISERVSNNEIREIPYISAILFNIKLMIPVISYQWTFESIRISDIISRDSVPSSLGLFSEIKMVGLFSEIKTGIARIFYPDCHSYHLGNPQINEDCEAYLATKLPRIHLGINNEHYVNKGFGNCLYAACAVADYRNRFIKNNSLIYSQSGVSSYDGEYQTKSSRVWWKKAIVHGIASKTNLAYHATLEKFIIAGWIPILVKPDKRIKKIDELQKEDTEYMALELFDHINRSNMESKAVKRFDNFLERIS